MHVFQQNPPESESQDLFPEFAESPQLCSPILPLISESPKTQNATDSEDCTCPTPVSSVFVDSQQQRADSRDSLNAFLSSVGQSPIKKVLTVPWDEASSRTRQDYVKEMDKVLRSAAEVLAPNDTDALLSACMKSNTAFQFDSDARALPAFAAAYINQDRGDVKKQILSIMCDKFTLRELQEYIPDLTAHMFKAARRHQLEHGRGMATPDFHVNRQRVTEAQVEHFIEFFTDHHMQDLPFRDKTLVLSSGVSVDVPQALLTSIPQTIITQYLYYCTEMNFKNASPSTLRRILDVCGTKYRYLKFLFCKI